MTDFDKDLAWSKAGRSQGSDLETVKALIPGCVELEVASVRDDQSGTDYFATLRRGARIKIDAKNRKPGASKWWTLKDGKKEEDLALERWSVMPGGDYETPQEKAKAGWTLSEQNDTDFILFKFDPSDSENVFLFSFQLLRIAFRRHINEWESQFKVGIQSSRNGYGTAWQSQCVFVPVSVVFRAVNCISLGKILIPADQFNASSFNVPINRIAP